MSKKTENKKTEEMLGGFFLLAAFKCPCCDDLGVMRIEEKNRIRKVSPKDIGINSVQEWRNMMGGAIEWIFSHEDEVISALPNICSESEPACEFLKDAVAKYTQGLEGGKKMRKKVRDMIKKCEARA